MVLAGGNAPAKEKPVRKKRSSLRITSIVAGIVALAALVLPSAPALATPQDGTVTIEKNNAFDRAHGVRSGHGTKHHPYVIEGWDLNQLTIHDTNRYVVIRNNIIGSLTLNWVGNRVKVVHNRISDLRVNENVARTGAPTSGRIAYNKFNNVGQLRHWDGVFTRNVVGSPPTNDGLNFDFASTGIQAANLDGFNGARYTHNVFYGFVELRLHGHHHSSGYGQPSHNHGGSSPISDLEHMNRYHEGLVANNTIYASGPYGLIYTDSNHAANDRTATSETDEALNDPHVHHTKLTIRNNKLIGSGIMIDIFNADDPEHLRTATGHVAINGNKIRLHEYRESVDGWDEPPNGIEVHQARDLHLEIMNNVITGPQPEGSRATTDMVGGYVAAGIELVQIQKASIHLMANSVTDRQAGIYAREFKNVEWFIHGLTTEGVAKRVDYDHTSSEPQK
jgi:hypothetical protein